MCVRRPCERAAERLLRLLPRRPVQPNRSQKRPKQVFNADAVMLAYASTSPMLNHASALSGESW